MSETNVALALETEQLILPTMLSYKRSISPGRALMFACSDLDGRDAEPLLVEVSSLRGTKAFDIWKNIEEAKKQNLALEKGIHEVTTPNPQRVESAFMPEHKPYLKVSFLTKYLANSRAPHMCNNLVVSALFKDVVRHYTRLEGFQYLGLRYVVPLATGQWMWRNNDEAFEKRIKITVLSSAKQQVFEFNPGYDAFNYSDLTVAEQQKVVELGSLIGHHLAHKPLALNVEAVYRMGGGTQAHPSQEMIMGDREKGDLSRTLYKVSQGGISNQAALHEQKLGNALRCIDEWHGHEQFGVQAIEPLGVVSTHQASTRVDSKRDFFSLCKSKLVLWRNELESAQSLATITDLHDLHYVIAVLVRGGAFV